MLGCKHYKQFKKNWVEGGEYTRMRTAAQTAVIMAVFTLVSKCFGFLREMVMANYYGTSYITDSYVMALAIPSMIFGGVIGAVSVAYIPTFSQVIEQEGEAKANALTSSILKVLTVVALIAAIMGICLSDQIVSIFASGFRGETARLTSYFVKITFSYLIFSATGDILEAFLRYKNVFIPQVAFGFLQNIILISTIVISIATNYYYLVFGYIIVYIIRLLIMFLISKNKGFKYNNTKLDNLVSKIMILALPVFIGNGMSQINTFVDKTLASGLPEGSVSALNYGSLLINMIMGLTITIMTTIIYPKLAQSSSTGDSDRISNIMCTGINLIFIIAVPCTLGAMVYNEQIVQIIYERGAFDITATSMTATAFFYYAIGLTTNSLNTLITQLYYSKHNMKTPVIFGGVSVIINITINLLLIKPMAHSGLALATSIASIIATALFAAHKYKKYPEIKIIRSYRKLLKIVIAALIAVMVSYILYKLLIILFGYIIVSRTVQLLLAVIIACIIYLILLWIMKIEELLLIKQIVKRQRR